MKKPQKLIIRTLPLRDPHGRLALLVAQIVRERADLLERAPEDLTDHARQMIAADLRAFANVLEGKEPWK